MNRRQLLFGGAATLAGFVLPLYVPRDKNPGQAVLWIVYVGGLSDGPEGLQVTRKVEANLAAHHFKVLDRCHEAEHNSRILARREVTSKWAHNQERRLISGEACLLESIGGVKAMWIEEA